MEKNNYLGNLPKRKYDLKRRTEERFYNYVLDGLRNVEYNTDNQILKDFKDNFTKLMIKKIIHGYDLDNYFDIRNVLIQIPEDLIIDLYDELVELLNKEDDENISNMESLAKVHYFPFLSSRVKTETGYISKTRKVTISDIYQAIISISRDMEGFISTYINNIIISSEMNLDELKILRDMLIKNETNAYYNKFEEKFGIFKNCNIFAFKKIYDIYYNELHHKFLTKVNREINKCGYHEQSKKEREYASYASNFILKNEKNKRNHWYRHK